MPPRVRYAPSPTGSPHVGNIRTAIFNWLYARKTGGKFIARLEDTDRDPARYRPETIREIEDSLRFLAIEPDEWWVSGGPYGPYTQSERLALYRDAAERLIAQGDAYRCYCTPERLTVMREEQQARGVPSGYDRRCRGLSDSERAEHEAAGQQSVVRMAVPLEGRTSYTDVVYGDISFENRLIDDQVLLKSNGWPTYHLAVVVDDHAMAITDVIRGEDWQPSTPKQVLLYAALGWEMPRWVHIPLTIGTDRKKLSKRHGSTQFFDFIRQGYLPESMFNFLVLLGWSSGDENRELFTVSEVLDRFRLEDMNRNPAVFDYAKLQWMNGEHIRSASPDRIADLCTPYLRAAGLVSEPPTADEIEIMRRAIPLVYDRLRVLNEVADLVSFFFHDPEAVDEAGRRKWLTGATARARLDAALRGLASLPEPLTEAAVETMVNTAAEAMGISRAPIIHTLRVAATGRTTGPGIFETLCAIGKPRLIRRLQTARDRVED